MLGLCLELTWWIWYQRVRLKWIPYFAHHLCLFSWILILKVKYLPSWLPFNNIHNFARKWRTLVYCTLDKPYEYVQQQIKQGIDRPSCTAEFIRTYESESGGIDTKSESLIKWASASLYARRSMIILNWAVLTIFLRLSREWNGENNLLCHFKRNDRSSLPLNRHLE